MSPTTLATVLLLGMTACGEDASHSRAPLQAGEVRLTRADYTPSPLGTRDAASWSMDFANAEGRHVLFSFETWRDGKCVENCGKGISRSGMMAEIRAVTVEITKLPRREDAEAQEGTDYLIIVGGGGVHTQKVVSFSGNPVVWLAGAGSHKENEDIVLAAIVEAKMPLYVGKVPTRRDAGDAVYVEAFLQAPTR